MSLQLPTRDFLGEALSCPVAQLAAEAEGLSQAIDEMPFQSRERAAAICDLGLIEARALETHAKSLAGVVYQLRVLRGLVIGIDGEVEADLRVRGLLEALDRGIGTVLDGLGDRSPS